MKEYKKNWKYKCFTVFEDNNIYFQIIDVEKPISWGEYLCNGKLYHDTLKECLFYTTRPIMYHGVNINTWQPDIFLKMDGRGNFYRDYHYDDTNLKRFEKTA